MSKNKTVLGRGLGALLSGVGEPDMIDERDLPTDDGKSVGTICAIDIARVRPNPFQPRVDFSPQALDEINAQMQRYLLVQLLASVGVGLATGIGFAFIGLKHAAVWGVAAGVLNLVPYVGSILVTIAAMLVAFLQFGELNPALDPRLLMVSLVGLTLFPAAGAPIWRQIFDAGELGVDDLRGHALALLDRGLELPDA